MINLKFDMFSPTASSPILLYSRQRYVLGDNAMHQMAQSSVFLSGMGGLGIEIGRLNVTLLQSNTVLYSKGLANDIGLFLILQQRILFWRVWRYTFITNQDSPPRDFSSSFVTLLFIFVQAVTLHDTKVCETWDLGSNFFIRKEDVSSQKMR